MANTLISQVPLGVIKPPSDEFGGAIMEGAAQNQGGGVVLSEMERFISVGLGVLTTVAGIFFLIFFFLAAFKWQTAGGDASKVQKARDEMVQGVIGMIIIVAAYGIIGIIGTILGIDILNPRYAITEALTGINIK